MNPNTHHTPACATRCVRLEVATIMAEMETIRVEVDAALDEYCTMMLDTWLMPQIQAALTDPTIEETR